MKTNLTSVQLKEFTPIFALFSIPLTSFLFIVGFRTFYRITQREKTTDEIKRKIASIRLFFIEKDPQIINYLPYVNNIFNSDDERHSEWEKPFSIGNWGLVKTIMLSNSMTGSFILFLLMLYLCINQLNFDDILSTSLAIIGFIIAALLIWLIKYEIGKKKFVTTRMVSANIEKEISLITLSEKPKKGY